MKIIAFYCENHTESVNTLFVENTVLCNVTARGKYR